MRYDPQYTVPKFPSTCLSISQWGAVAVGKKWPLVATPKGKSGKGMDSEAYAQNIIEPHLARFKAELEAEGKTVLVVEDGARLHYAPPARAAKAAAGISNLK